MNKLQEIVQKDILGGVAEDPAVAVPGYLRRLKELALKYSA